MLLAGCSGGNSSSSGSGGASSGSGSQGGSTAVREGEYTGTIQFYDLSDSVRITIDVTDNGRVTITSDGGTATGNVSGNSFNAAGTLSFNLANQTCTASTSFDGTAFGNTLSGTVSAPSAMCIEDGMSFSISLDGDFTASK